ncbi:MAG: NUDIX domain-containing protein [Bacteroidales bacterium]
MASSIQTITPAIRFFDPAANEPLPYTFSIIVSRYRGQWIWVKHKDRNTWELPAGHLESGETPHEAAHRELYEETGALDFSLDPIVSYEGILNGKPVYGMIFFAKILELGPLPDFEIGEIGFFKGIPEQLTYPQIQPAFFNYITEVPTPPPPKYPPPNPSLKQGGGMSSGLSSEKSPSFL